MTLPYEWLIGWRYTRAGRTTRRNGFISFISGVSMLGIALGVAALIIVLSVMNGFQKEVRDRMLSVVSHIEVLAPPGQALTDPAKVQAMRGDLSLLRADAVESFRINPVYYVGDLPWWRRLWFALHGHPILLATVGILSGLILSLLVFLGLHAMARRRLNQST